MTHVFPRMHVSLYVSDIAQTVAFYNRFFGTEPAKVKPAYAKYVLAEPSLIISFVERAELVKPHFGHLGFQVETEAQLAERLAAAQRDNLVSSQETGTNCCYAKQDKFWALDPDGYRWEVYYFHEDAEFNDPHYTLEKKAETSACSLNAVVAPSACGCSAKVATQETKEVACC